MILSLLFIITLTDLLARPIALDWWKIIDAAFWVDWFFVLFSIPFLLGSIVWKDDEDFITENCVCEAEF